MKLNEEEDLEKFIVEQRQRIAKDREVLDKNPTSAVAEYILDSSTGRRQKSLAEKEQIPPGLQDPVVAPGKGKPPTPQFLKLGESYQKQKQRLNDELKQDYRKALAEKQVRTTGIRGKLTTTYEQSLAANYEQTPRIADNSDLGLSLPIRDHLSAKKKDSGPTAETYEEILQKKRRQEKTYRKDDLDDLDRDAVIYREKSRRKEYIDDDDDYRRVRIKPQRRSVRGSRYYEEDSLDDSEEDLIRKIRARRKKRMTQRYVESDEEDDEADFEKNHPREAKQGRRRLNSAQPRQAKDKLVQAEKQNDLRSKSAPPDQEFTGLPIGQVPSANTVQRRKDEYKLELQRQMEQNQINKRRERELELQVDASGANDPGKKPNRGIDLTPRQQKPALKRADSLQGGGKESGKSPRRKKKTSFRRDSSDEGSEEDERRRPRWFPRQPGGYYPPPPALPNYYQPPPTQFPSPYDDAYFYYGSRNPLDPASVVGPIQAPPGAASYPGVSPMMAAVATRGAPTTAPPVTTNEFTQDTLTTRTTRGRTGDKFESSLVADETRDSVKKKEMMTQYQEELRQQMMIKEKKKEQAKLEQERYDRKMEEEARNYNPWGKGGGGAPMRDVHGKLVSDLRQMHLENEDLVRDPSKVVDIVKQRQQTERTLVDLNADTFPTDQDGGTENALSPRFGRNNPFEQKETVEQKTQRDMYKEELEKQIAERRREEAVRKEKLRIEDEKQERRMEEQIKKMQDEYDEERRKKQQKIDEQRRKNEELQQAAEERKKEEERKKREERERREEEKRQEQERELQQKLNQNKPRSPPIRVRENPAHSTVADVQRSVTRSEQPQHPNAVEEQRPPVGPRLEVQRGNSPQIAAVRPNNSRDSKRVSRELSALRKQLLSEQRRIENQLRASDVPAQMSNYQPRMRPETLVDLSMSKQRPVQVRRPPTSDRPSSKALREFSDFKHRQDDTTSLKMFRLDHPETPDNSSALERQQEDLIRTQLKKIETLRSGSNPPHFSKRTPTNDSRNGFTLIPPESRASLLDADTAYIPIPDDADSRPPSARTPVIRGRKSSARERRRQHKQSDNDEGVTYRAADTYSLNSLNSLATLDVDRLANKNQDRLDKLKALQGDEVSLTDPDDILDRFVNQQRSEIPETPDGLPRGRPRQAASVGARERPPSVNTLDTELWMRPGTTT
uniref:Centrosome and spindle pole-associated protein 1-like n=1 Tax=Phallusia mammillata TaxID=59560 RepID=A0A6F9DAX3_9ASCI|nr:centrosome and spindle pole-associated protein 1-like [Phallusia mammillata]